MKSVILLLSLIAMTTLSFGADFIWQEPQAKILPNGQLEWMPERFMFEAGETVRYIDYENGDDSNPGSKASPWKHHPWDSNANAKAADRLEGPVTYIFKGGVMYRGKLIGTAQGTEEEPVRLTRDPSWGKGEAVLAGSYRITGGWKQGGDGLSEKVKAKDQIWYIDLPKGVSPRNFWMLNGDGVDVMTMARHPNWRIEGDNDDDPKKGWFKFRKTAEHVEYEGKMRYQVLLDEELPRDPDFYGGKTYIRYEWGPVMGTPTPGEIYHYDPEANKLIIHSFFMRLDKDPNTYLGSRRIFSGSRYSFENNPIFIDEPGEWYFADEKQRLYVLLDASIDPNEHVYEVGELENLLVLKNCEHLQISGLTFRYMNMPARLEWVQGSHQPAVIQHKGVGNDIVIKNNFFEHINEAIHIYPGPDGTVVNNIVVADNQIYHADQAAINIESKGSVTAGRIGDVKLLRNKMYAIGFRPMRQHNGHAVNLGFPETLVMAGNILHRTGGWGLCTRGGKQSGQGGKAPFTRQLIFHNSVTDPMLFSNDWGGIETWQGGPFYIFNNVVHNPIGVMGFSHRRFGHAYYMDGAFKNYLFNNIASGEFNVPSQIESNCAAFQEIHSYQNTMFNNTVYKYLYGSRRQAAQYGRNKFISNIFDDIGERVFRHSDSKNTDPNARDAGVQTKRFDYTTNAYTRNALHDVEQVGNFHALGGDYETLEAFSAGLEEVNTLASDVGVASDEPLMRDPENFDFRLHRKSAARDMGSKVFVPWSLYGVVGEWHFVPMADDPTLIDDEHWYMYDAHVSRHHYGDVPVYPLEAVNASKWCFTEGLLEDWADGALELDGEKRYLRLRHEDIARPVRYTHRGKNHVAKGKDKPTVDIYDQNFLIECIIKTDDRSGVIVQKLDGQNGYRLALIAHRLVLRLYTNGTLMYSVQSRDKVDLGDWSHLVAEVDRKHGATLYANGHTIETETNGFISSKSLANSGDFLVAGGPGVEGLECTIDFLRVAHGTLADAKTTIEELYSWQFDGPQLRDFVGRYVIDKKRDAGALEYQKD